MKRTIQGFLVPMLALWLGGGIESPPTSVAQTATTAATSSSSTLPAFGHVVIVVGENSDFSSTYNSSNMPYLTNLANTYGLGINYFADTHPSIGNYFVLTAGQVITNDDSQTPSSLPLSVDNIALEVQNAGKTWKDYVETWNGCGALHKGTYYVRHDPLQYFTNINTESANFVCFSQFATDLSNKALPNLSWLVPNGCDDAHDCSLGTFDNWIQTELGPLLSSSYFQAGGDGLLIIVFDEDSNTGTSCGLTTGTGCGGQVEAVVISPSSKLGYQSSGSYEHENALRTMAQGLGLNYSGLGAAAKATPMSDFFNATTSTGSVTISPTSLTFSSQGLDTSSLPQSLTLTNGTSSTVSGVSISISGTNSGSFSETNNCSSSLAASASCTINVTFTPTLTGTLTATLNTGVTGVTTSLTGTGVATTASVSPTSLTFPSQTVGTTSASQAVTLSNTGTVTMLITSIATSANFDETNNCGSSLAAGANCTINVTFTPTTTGTLTGTLTVSDTASNSPQTVSLSGSGVSSSGGGSPAISLSSSPSSVSVTQGQSTSSTITVTPSGGFTGTVSLSASCPAGVTCSLSSSSVTISGTTAQSVTLNIGTSSTTATGTDTLTVTGTSGSLTSQTTVSLTVNAAPTSSACPSGSTSYYVSTTGSDSTGNGSATNPWATIQFASTKIGPGACVHVAAGTYVSNDKLLTNMSGTSSARITYVSDTPWGARIVNNTYTCTQAVSGSSCNEHLWDNEGSYVTIQGFDLSGDAYQGIGNGGSNVQIIGNHVHNVVPADCTGEGGAGIDDHGNSSDDIGNVVNDVANFSLGSCGFVHGIYADRTGGHIWNNIVYHNWSNGIQLWGDPQSVTISGNTVLNNGLDGIVYGTDKRANATSNMLVTDNIFAWNGNYGFDEQGYTGSGNQFIDNLSFGNGLGFFSLQTGTQTGTVEANPQLVNYQGTSDPILNQLSDAALYFELQSSSPAINAGTSTGAPSFDFAGNPRPTGSAWDIGAYQFLGTTSIASAISLSSSPSSVSVTQGQSTSSTITVTPSGGFTGTVSLSASCPAGVTCSLSSSSVTISGTTAQSVTLNIGTSSTTATGTDTLTVTGTSGSLSSQTTVSLTVSASTSTGSGVTITPNPLTFPNTTVGTTSAIETATLTNSTSSALTITAPFTITGPFAFAGSGNCPAVGQSVPAGGSCTMTVDFTPTTTGTFSGTVTVFDNFGTGSQTLSLTGTGVSSTTTLTVSVLPTSLDFGQVSVGSTSAPQTVTATNTSGGTVTISSVVASPMPPFAETDNCAGASLTGAGSTCTISVTFTPQKKGRQSGSLTITDNASGSPQVVSLTGRGAP